MKRGSRFLWLTLMMLGEGAHLRANEIGTLFFSPAERQASAPASSAGNFRIQGITKVGAHWVVWLGVKPITQQEVIAGWRFMGMKKGQFIFTAPTRGEIRLMMGDVLPLLDAPVARGTR